MTNTNKRIKYGIFDIQMRGLWGSGKDHRPASVQGRPGGDDPSQVQRLQSREGETRSRTVFIASGADDAGEVGRCIW